MWSFRKAPGGRGPKRFLRSEPGFTLVELLVVMLILGILAAIAIPAFFSQSEKAQNAEAKHNAETARKAVSVRLTENGDDLDAVTVDDIRRIEPSLNSANELYLLPSTAGLGGYVIAVRSKTGTYFGLVITNQRITQRYCQPAGASGCSSSGTW